MDSIFNTFMNGPEERATDYYYTINARGAKIYHSRITGKVVAKNRIPDDFLPHIPLRSKDSQETLLRQRKEYLDKIKELEKKVKDIDTQLDPEHNPEDDETWREKRKAEIKKEQERAYRDFFSHFKEETKTPPPKKEETKAPPPKKTQFPDILKQHNIRTRKEWRDWLLTHHPDKDKNIDLDLCQEIIRMGKSQGW